MQIVVVDASVLIDAYLGIERVWDTIRERELHAPVSVDAEVVHGLRRAWFDGRVTDDDARSVIRILKARMMVRHPVNDLTTRMWSLRRNVSAYDAGYVALAESLAVPLLTRDRRLSRSSGHAARIEYIA